MLSVTDEPAPLANLIGPCPECGNGRMVEVIDSEGVPNTLCRECGNCWHSELDWSRRVAPSKCPGCASRAICESTRRPYGGALPRLS